MLNITEVHWRTKPQIPIFLGVKPEALQACPSFQCEESSHSVLSLQSKLLGEPLLQFWAVPAHKAGCAPHVPFLLSSSNKPLPKRIANAEQQELTLGTAVWLYCGLVNLQLWLFAL